MNRCRIHPLLVLDLMTEGQQGQQKQEEEEEDGHQNKTIKFVKVK